MRPFFLVVPRAPAPGTFYQFFPPLATFTNDLAHRHFAQKIP
jgi:hypothetical protein